jgi:hypothetical protein
MKNRKVFKFNELMDPEMGIELGLYNFLKDPKDSDYFFDVREVNKLWDEGVIKVYVYNVRFDGDSLIFKTKITIYEDEFDIYIFFDDDENVEFGSEKDVDLDDFDLKIERFLKEEYFQDMFFDIYDEIIPHDFWQVKSKMN